MFRAICRAVDRLAARVTLCAGCNARGTACMGWCGEDALVRTGRPLCLECIRWVGHPLTLPENHVTAQDCADWRDRYELRKATNRPNPV